MRTQKAIDKIVQSPVPPSITNVVWFDTINNLLKFYINGEWRAPNDENSQADWDETDTASPAYINNKPTIPDASPFVAGTGEKSAKSDYTNISATARGSFAQGTVLSGGIQATGYGSQAGGNVIKGDISATGSGAFARGFADHDNSSIVASASGAHAEGYVLGGGRIIASGEGSHAEGISVDSAVLSIAAGVGSHIEGNGCSVHADARAGHAEGELCKVLSNGPCSHAEGDSTQTNNVAEHAEGRYNKTTRTSSSWGHEGNTLHSVGCGSINNRKNAHEIMQNGDHYVYGVGGYDGTNSNTTGVKTLQNILNTSVISTSVRNVVTCTLTEYGNISPKDPDTLYIILEDE